MNLLGWNGLNRINEKQIKNFILSFPVMQCLLYQSKIVIPIYLFCTCFPIYIVKFH